MTGISCFYYVTESGKSPVRDFIDALDYSSQRKFFFVKSLLEEFGHRLPQPHAKYIGDEIFELRFKGQEGQIRILYFFFIRIKQYLLTVLLKSLPSCRKKRRHWLLREEKHFLKDTSEEGAL